jgi:tetratricopeptide (TPR) repeat protein
MALALLLAHSSFAHAQRPTDVKTYLISIQRLFADLEYERALRQIQLAQQMPRKPEEDVTLALYEGIIQCELGEQEQSIGAFKSALLLQPDVKLPVQVSPKVGKLFESVRQQVKLELARREAQHKQAEPTPPPPPPVQPPVQAAAPPPTNPPEPVPQQSEVRSYSLIPAIAGGALVIAGGISWGVSRSELNQLRSTEPKLATLEEVQHSMSRGRTQQTLGVTLLSLGAASLATAAGMYVLGAPDKSVKVGVSTNGTSAFVYGRWP